MLLPTDGAGHLLDVNVLVALVFPDHIHHKSARAWLGGLGPEDRWMTTPMTEAGVVRILLNPGVVGQQLDGYQAVAVLSQFRAEPDHSFLPDSSSLVDPSISLAALVGAKQVSDFHLVNLAVKNDLRFVTFDGRLVGAIEAEDRRHVLLLP